MDVFTDQCVDEEIISAYHRHLAQNSWQSVHEELCELEPMLGAYVLHTAFVLCGRLDQARAPQLLINAVRDEMLCRMLVIAMSMRQGQHKLWEDFVTGTNNEGDDMTQPPQRPIRPLAFARRDHSILICIGEEDLRQIRPAWMPSEAEYFLIENATELTNIATDAALNAVQKIIEKHEKSDN